MKKEKQKIGYWEKEETERLANVLHSIYQNEAKRQRDIRYPDRYEDLPERIKEFDRVLARYILVLLQKNRQKFIDALIWCSGSDDFQIGGKARKGWEKMCLPLIKDEK